MSEYGLTPKHSFGQNFLADQNLTAKIAALAQPQAGDRVLELGAGLGALTNQLLRAGARVTAVERDRDLLPVLGEVFAQALAQDTLRLLEADAKSLDWVAAMRGSSHAESAPWVLTGNLPYQITGPLIEKAVGSARHIKRAVFLVQKEVADRLAAQPGSKSYGLLSVFTQAQFVCRRAFVIRPSAFVPKPRVDSAVIVLDPLATPVCEETGDFRTLVKSAFAARRKTLRNAWKSVLPAEQLRKMADECSISLDARGETLSVQKFAHAAQVLSSLRATEESA